MKITGLIFFLLVAICASAQENQPTWNICRNPVRMFKGQATVNLSPLFQWWARQPLFSTNNVVTETNASPEEERPLSAWYRVTGTKIGIAGSSWMLDAVVYTSPTIHTNARVYLNHPPTLEEQTFYSLKTQLTDADQQIMNLRQTYEVNTNEEQIALRTVDQYRRSLSKVAPDGVRNYSVLAQQKHDAAAAALSQLDQLQAARDQIVKQLEKIPSVDRVYQVDWFAVLLGHTKQGIPIYDLGLVSPTPP